MYRKKHPQILCDAVVIDEEAIKDIANGKEAIEGVSARKNRQRLSVVTPEGRKEARPGDVVIKFEDGTLDAMSKDKFEASFEPLEAAPVATDPE